MDYLAPGTLKAAVTHLVKAKGSACVVAGGTDVLTRVATGKAPRPRVLVSLRDVPGLNEVHLDRKGFVRIGARVTLAEVAGSNLILRRLTGLAEAAGMIGSEQVRSTATLVGNVCSASSAADAIPPLLCSEAVLEVVGPRGRRLVPVQQLLTGPRTTSLKRGEVVAAIRVPVPKGRIGTVYRRHAPRSAMDCATVIAAAQVSARKDRIVEARLALGAVHPVPVRCPTTEKILEGRAPTAEVLAEAADAAVTGIEPISDIRASADHRRMIVRRIVPEVLIEAFVRAGGVRR